MTKLNFHHKIFIKNFQISSKTAQCKENEVFYEHTTSKYTQTDCFDSNDVTILHFTIVCADPTCDQRTAFPCANGGPAGFVFRCIKKKDLEQFIDINHFILDATARLASFEINKTNASPRTSVQSLKVSNNNFFHSLANSIKRNKIKIRSGVQSK